MLVTLGSSLSLFFSSPGPIFPFFVVYLQMTIQGVRERFSPLHTLAFLFMPLQLIFHTFANLDSGGRQKGRNVNNRGRFVRKKNGAENKAEISAQTCAKIEP